jgi:hypothetical protein
MKNDLAQDQFDILRKAPEWVAVVDVVREQIAGLLDIRNVDTTQDDATIAREVRARYLAVDQLINFYNKYQFANPKKEDQFVSFK